MIHVQCCQHIKENIVKNNEVFVVSLRFWKMIKAKTIAKVKHHMKQLHREFLEAAAALQKIDFAIYIVVYVFHHCWNNDINFVNECVNDILKMKRKLNFLNLFNSIWNRVMMIQFKCFCKSQIKMQKETFYILYCAKLHNEAKHHVDELTVKLFTYNEAKIIISDDYIYDVRIQFNDLIIVCSCFKFQTTEMSCDHVLAFFQHQYRNLNDFLLYEFSLNTWMMQHFIFLFVVNTFACASDSDNSCDSFYIRVSRDRSRKKRFRVDEFRRRWNLLSVDLQMNQQV